MENNGDALLSVLQLKNLYFEKINFTRDTNLPKKFQTKFSTQFNEISTSEIVVKLHCNITSDTKFMLDITLVGCFKNNETDPTNKEQINKTNTISIMFPYLRSEVSLVTAQPNFPTIDLPVVNINALLEEQGELVGSRA
ncbi:MAG: protein-export chaperone SecB [Clostridia bacterium]|nr:protein-export chaperone SecB [Clostridia bacterium]